MRRVPPLILLALLSLSVSVTPSAVGSDNAIAGVSGREGIDTGLLVDVLTLLALSLTAGIVGWYSWETRQLRIATARMREEAARATEIECHPWLVGSDLKVDLPDAPVPSLWLPVKNVGKTPALNVLFVSEFFFRDERIRTTSHQIGFVAPNDVANFRIAVLSNTPKEPFGERVAVTITYATHLKGAGSIVQNFEKIGGGWVNREAEYTFTLSTGQTYSGSPLAT